MTKHYCVGFSLVLILALLLTGCSDGDISKTKMYGFSPDKDTMEKVLKKFGKPYYSGAEDYYLEESINFDYDRRGFIDSMAMFCQPFEHIDFNTRGRVHKRFNIPGNPSCKNLTREDVIKRFGKPDEEYNASIKYVTGVGPTVLSVDFRNGKVFKMVLYNRDE